MTTTAANIADGLRLLVRTPYSANEFVMLRKYLGLSQQDLSGVIQTSPQAIVRWENHGKEPTNAAALMFLLRYLAHVRHRLGLSQDEMRQMLRTDFLAIPDRLATMPVDTESIAVVQRISTMNAAISD